MVSWGRWKNRLKGSQRGSAALETCITLPIFLALVFFILEMIKVNNTRTAMESMAAEATFYFIRESNTLMFNEIIDKYKPGHVNSSDIKYYFAIYENLETMCKDPPFGGEDIYWSGDSTTKQTSPSTYLQSDPSSPAFLARTGDLDVADITNPAPPSGLHRKAFVLTFVCNYKFSSDFVAKLFSGGANTTDRSMYLLWGRGCGICL
ncbi:MAG: pilus assembly protein [Holosporaceae bacterium]|nr:pilus assembly protein [Holosporaceae bacterium]